MRLVATDLDGTFLVGHTEISPTNVRALDAAADAGVPVVFATGRPTRWMEFLRPYAERQPLAVVSNGAGVYHLGDRRYLHRFDIDRALLPGLRDDLRAALPGCALALEYGEWVAREPGYQTSEVAATFRIGTEVEDVLAADEAPLKLLLQYEGLPTDELYERVVPVVGDRLTVTYSFVHPSRGVLEMSAPGVSKAHALQTVAADLGVPAAEVCAFGDMPNDLEMLRWAGRGFAMPHAHPMLVDAGMELLTGDPGTAVGRTVLALLGQAPDPVAR